MNKDNNAPKIGTESEEKTCTCQICARPIKAKNGIIAHHGYKRPIHGSGWQTASCAGARHLPYEVSCDMLPPTIQHVKDYIVGQKNRIKDLMANPPEKLMISMGYYSTPKEVIRPVDFDPKKETHLQYVFYSYESEFNRCIHDIEQSIKFAKIDVEFMEKRLKDWVPPKETQK